ncbi:hypothetical protein N0K08_22470 [Acidovorax sp. Be4]|uniref:Uncharacterized protein n=1 Tax=Acidovorax bellezanensis TaxID=2976702 RepID=A0ABT2PSF4_9BURK|nr:hypothetical protein [Acidovorax sp. Be4]MCT9813405.1 hypothetical protein [Acidovorax sp. Be4]
MAIVLIVSTLAQAGPAPWYWWASKLDGQQICRQTSPGAGWERASGPFRNPRCTT